jgi:hypothetical protein
MTEEVGKGRVLTEVIGVVGIVEWRLNITGQEYQTLANATAQLAAACYVCLFAEHNILFLVFIFLMSLGKLVNLVMTQQNKFLNFPKFLRLFPCVSPILNFEF